MSFQKFFLVGIHHNAVSCCCGQIIMNSRLSSTSLTSRFASSSVFESTKSLFRFQSTAQKFWNNLVLLSALNFPSQQLQLEFPGSRPSPCIRRKAFAFCFHLLGSAVPFLAIFRLRGRTSCSRTTSEGDTFLPDHSTPSGLCVLDLLGWGKPSASSSTTGSGPATEGSKSKSSSMQANQ